MTQFILKLQNNLLKNIPENLLKIKSTYQLEKSLRHLLCTNDIEHKYQIIYLFEAFFIENIYRGKLQMIWVANYCLFSLKDESLAKVKISRIKTIPEWNLEADFQEYNCNKNIKASSLSESAQFINYLQQLHTIKKKDLKLCIALLKFWEELTSLRPNLNRMIKALFWIDKKMQFLIDKYSELSTKFPNCRESLSLYASLMKNIIFDKEKSHFLENKLGAINIKITNYDSIGFSCFENSNAVLIFSAEKEDFGRILFSNTQAKDIMKCTSSNVDENSIKSFIPLYYWENLKECTIWYSHFCSESEIVLNEEVFLDLHAESFINCVGKVSITTVSDFLVFILVFNENCQINQIALLSENGEILSHSKKFPKYAGKDTDSLVGYNIKNLFSGSEEYSLYKDGAPSNRKLHYSTVQFHNLKIFYAFFLSDYEDKSISKAFSSKKVENETISYQSLGLPGSEWFNKGLKESYSGEATFDSEMDLNQSHVSEENWQDNKFYKIMVSSSRKINILHVIFIFSILSVICTNIVVLFYAFSNINFIRNMDLPLALGNTDAILQHVSLTARILWSLSYYGGPSSLPTIQLAWSFFPIHLSALKELYFSITTNLPDWNYCSGQSIFSDKNVKIWTSNENSKINLLDLLSKSIQIGSEFERKYINNESYTEEIMFLTLNNFGEVTKYCNDSLYQVIDCQKSIMLDFKTEVFLLLIAGVGVLALSVCIMIPLCCSIINYENEIWNNLRKKAFENYSEMERNLLERIKNIHCQSGIVFNNRSPSNKKIDFKSYWKYIWRISIYFIVVITFSVINITLLYEKCTDYLSYRPYIMREMINKQILQNSLAIWTTLSQFKIWGFPSVYQDYNIYPYMNNSAEFQKTVLLLKQSSLNLRNPKYSPIISNSFKTVFYEKDNYMSDYFNYGANFGEELLLSESYFYANSNMIPYMWQNWLLNIFFINLRYSDLANEIDQYSQSIIEDQLSAIVATFVIFTASSIIIYFALYFVFFKKYKHFLKKMNSILKLIPK